MGEKTASQLQSITPKSFSAEKTIKTGVGHALLTLFIYSAANLILAFLLQEFQLKLNRKVLSRQLPAFELAHRLALAAYLSRAV